MKKILGFVILCLLLSGFVYSDNILDFDWDGFDLDMQQLGRKYKYMEEFYSLYCQTMQERAMHIATQIDWLTLAENAPYAHPVYALAKIRNKKEWEKYQFVLKMHISFLLAKTYMRLAGRYDKENIYWFNVVKPEIKEAFLKAFKVARVAYKYALEYWNKTKTLAAEVYKRSAVDLLGSQIDAMEHEAAMIINFEKYSKMNEQNMNINHRTTFLEYDFDRVIPQRIEEIDKKIEKINNF